MADVSKRIHDDVKDYYGKLKSSKDLKCDIPACALTGKMMKSVREAIAAVHEDVRATFYGCGMTIPPHVEGLRVLDLGSGSGHDCFAISKLVGSKGSVVGIDMTEKQLAIARKFEDYHRESFGYKEKNTEFVKGYLEDLKAAGLKENDFDLIVSNCTVNLVPDKKAVLREAYRVLKPGGEMYFSDLYTEKELPKEVREDKVLWGEGLAGATPWKDFISFSKECGFSTPRLVSASRFNVNDQQVASKVAGIKYVSARYRMFKLAGESEPQGASVKYNGALPEYEQELMFDSEITFKTRDSVEVDAELAAIIQSTRYASFFEVTPSTKKSKVDSTTSNIPTDPFSVLSKQKCSKGDTGSGNGCADNTKKSCTPK